MNSDLITACGVRARREDLCDEIKNLTGKTRQSIPTEAFRNAGWIWGGAEPRPQNAYRLFRKEHCLEDVPGDVDVWIFAEFRYKLYINGKFVVENKLS